jgi:hypothetical protein
MLIEGTTLQLVGGIISGVRCLSDSIFPNIYPASPRLSSGDRKVVLHVIMFHQQLTDRRTNPEPLRQHEDPPFQNDKSIEQPYPEFRSCHHHSKSLLNGQKLCTCLLAAIRWSKVSSRKI